MSRICRSAMEKLEADGIHVGLIRPISIYPYPEKAFINLPKSIKALLVCELSTGQMIDDVKFSVQ